MVWTATQNRFGLNSFFSRMPDGPRVPVTSVPVRLHELMGQSATFIRVWSPDLMVAEDIGYPRRLFLAGVPTGLFVVRGAFDAFDPIAPDAQVLRRFPAAKGVPCAMRLP